jgi:hypothetical protein
MIMKFFSKILMLLILISSSIATPSFAARPAPMNKTGIFKSKCNQIEVFKITDADSSNSESISFNLEISDCKSSLGSIQNGVAFLGCGGEGCGYYFERGKCNILISSYGKVLEVNGAEDSACGFSRGVKADGKYKRK